jgi:hypothetical protein
MNGASAALTRAFDPPIEASIKAAMPSDAEQRIGEAAAAAATIGQGVVDFEAAG